MFNFKIIKILQMQFKKNISLLINPFYNQTSLNIFTYKLSYLLSPTIKFFFIFLSYEYLTKLSFYLFL